MNRLQGIKYLQISNKGCFKVQTSPLAVACSVESLNNKGVVPLYLSLSDLCCTGLGGAARVDGGLELLQHRASL